MNVPEEFRKACCNLHQDVDLFAATPEDLVSIAVNDFSEFEKRIVKDFLEKTLRGVSNGAALRNVWRATGSDIRFPKSDDLLLILTLMLKRVS